MPAHVPFPSPTSISHPHALRPTSEPTSKTIKINPEGRPPEAIAPLAGASYGAERNEIGPAPLADVGPSLRSAATSSKRLLDATAPPTPSVESAPLVATAAAKPTVAPGPPGLSRGSSQDPGPHGTGLPESKVRLRASPALENQIAQLEAETQIQQAQIASLHDALAHRNKESAESMRQLAAAHDAHAIKRCGGRTPST